MAFAPRPPARRAQPGSSRRQARGSRKGYASPSSARVDPWTGRQQRRTQRGARSARDEDGHLRVVPLTGTRSLRKGEWLRDGNNRSSSARRSPEPRDGEPPADDAFTFLASKGDKGHNDVFSILTSDERLRQKLARKMWAASYTGASYSTVDERGDAQDSDTLAGGQDWKTLFERYDRDHSGGLEFSEFCDAIRRDARISPAQVADGELREVFNFIDVDHDKQISCWEFVDFLRKERQKEHDGGAKQHGSKKRIAVFLAESIALERIIMRASASLASERVGVLSPGEIVAVTHISGNRMHVRRLRWSADFDTQTAANDSGWVSERTDGGTGRLLLEVLPRDEWTSKIAIESALASRVAQLAAMRRLAAGHTTPGLLGAVEAAKHRPARPATAGAAREGQGDDGSAEGAGGDEAEPGEGRGGSGTDVPGMLAKHALERCKDAREAEALLSILEREPREQWASLLARQNIRSWDNGARSPLRPRRSR